MLLRFKATRNLRHILKNSCLLAICWGALAVLPAHADETFKHGAVMARSLALDEKGQPILVEYNEDGSEGSVIGIPSEYKTRVSELIIIDTAEYRQQKDLLKEYKEHYKETLAKDAELLSREQYLGRTYTTANGKDTITPKEPPKYIKSMLVRGRSNTITKDPDQLILRGFTVDLSQDYEPPEKGTLVLTPKGQVITSSSLNIGPRVGFFGDPNKKQEFYSASRKFDDKIFGPVPFAKVYVSPEVFPGSLAVTDEKGKYSMRYYLGFCPMFMDMETDIWTELHYANFSPNGMPVLPFYLRRQDWSSCWDPVFMGASNLMAAMAYVEVLAIKASSAIPIYNIDFKVDVMFLSGKVLLKNPDNSPVDIGDITEYKADPADKNPIAQQFYDFDGDGKPDRSLVGKMVTKTLADGSTEKSFEEDTQKGDIQAIFFSSSSDTTQTKTPDLIRQADTKKLLGNNGLLKSISKDDLKKTDILVFRESTGDLILERKGLKDEEINGRVESGLGKDDKYFFYRLMLRGPMDNALNIGGTVRTGTWEEWSTKNKLAEPFRKRESDLLKPGEWIRLVIINRVTGYMSSKRIQLSDASKNAGNTLSIPLDEINLMPPNLKIWAERSYKVEKGLTKDEERNYLIGTEGAALASDAKIEVYSEWFDEEGRPLPEGLGADNGEQYGLTGRLAKVVSKNSLAAVSQGQLASFPIAPGRHTQVLRVKDNLQSPEHFYIHVSGTQKDEKPAFDAAGNHAAAPFDSRPKGLTPFLTPLYDENTDWQVYNAYRDIKREQAKQETPPADKDKPIKPLASYAWGYRPEYQFSQYSLEINKINRVNQETGKPEDKQDILDKKSPIISSSDQLIEVLYSLVGNNTERLDSFDGPQDLVLALGQEELKLQIGKNKQIRFDNIKQLASLSPEDFLTMRLYTNQDAGNILWEYAFEHVVLYPSIDVNTVIEIPADNNKFAMSAIYLGYSSRSEEKKTPKSIVWEVDGNIGYFSPTSESAKAGVFSSVLNTTTVSDIKGQFFIRTDDGQKVAGPHIKTVAGAPFDIKVTSEGKATISERGEITLTVKVKDKYSNKISDGTEVKVAADSDLVIDGTGLTENGETTFKIRGYHSSGEKQLTVTAGEIETDYKINITPVELNIIAPLSAQPDTIVPIKVTATADDINLNGLTIDLRTDRGNFASNIVTLSSGQAITQFATGKTRGNAQLMATLAGELTATNISIDNPALNIAETLLVGDRPSNGKVTVDKGNGESFEQDYVVSTQLTVNGKAGDTVPVRIGDLANPAIEPLLYYSMNNVYGDKVVGDSYNVINGTWQGAIQATESNQGFDGSFSFNLQTIVTVPKHSALNKTGNIGVGFETKLNAPGIIYSYPASGQTLELLADSTLRFSQKTLSGSEQLDVPNIALNSWHRIGAHLHNGKLQLEIDGKLSEKNLTGQPKAEAITDTAITIGGGFVGLLNNFRVIDWNSPLLSVLPNGDTSMNVVIGSSGSTNVQISSTGQMGKRLVASYDPTNPLGLPIPNAYADTGTGSSWLGRVTAGAQKLAVGFVDAHVYAAQMAEGFARGVILGDTSTPAGLAGDIALGFVPFGDSRDIALQNYYKYMGDTKNYDEVVLYLAYIGLGADALMLIPATTVVGTPLNAAVAFIKPAVKLIRKLPMRGVLAKELEKLAKLAMEAKKSGNWVPFVDRAKGVLPFLQLFAAVAIDEKLRTLLSNAVRNSVDFDNWLKYLASAPADMLAQQNKLQLVPEAYAAVSGFKKLLREVSTHGEQVLKVAPEKAGQLLGDAVDKLANNAGELTKIAHDVKTVKAVMNIMAVGEKELVDKMKTFSKFGRRKIDDVVDDLAVISLDAAKMHQDALKGYKQLIGELAAKGNKAKGAAHHLQVIRVFQDKGYKIINVEALEVVNVFSTKLKNMRRYDILVEIGGQTVRVECKSWNFENVEALTKRYLKSSSKNADGVAKDADELADVIVEGQQLFADLLSFAQNGNKGFKWMFDEAMTDGGKLFKETVEKALKNDAELRSTLRDVLSKEGKISDNDFKIWINKLVDSLDDFVEVLPKK